MTKLERLCRPIDHGAIRRTRQKANWLTDRYHPSWYRVNYAGELIAVHPDAPPLRRPYRGRHS